MREHNTCGSRYSKVVREIICKLCYCSISNRVYYLNHWHECLTNGMLVCECVCSWSCCALYISWISTCNAANFELNLTNWVTVDPPYAKDASVVRSFNGTHAANSSVNPAYIVPWPRPPKKRRTISPPESAVCVCARMWVNDFRTN